MANITVYPFGEGGQLPANIGIVNDYVTGGADKALSAEVGKTFGEKLFDTWSEIDLSELTVNSGSLGSDSKWFMQGMHIAYPVTPGDNIMIKVTGKNSYNGGWYGFLNSNYTPPSAATTIPYATGYYRVWLNTGTTATLTIPNNAAYLCMCPKDGGGESTWQAWEFETESPVLDRDDVVNDLYRGGSDSPLSAEQGKIIAEKTFGAIPTDLVKYPYTGSAVNVYDSHHVSCRAVTTVTSQNFQGGACFGDYLFMFTENNTTCWMYDLSTGTLVQTISIPSSDRGFVNNCHCNTVNFGHEYYDQNDPFPLIYVSTGYRSGGYSGALAYRIVATTEDDTTTYSLELVQTLKMPGDIWTEFVVGDDGDCYLCYTSYRRIYRMAMPTLAQGDMVFDLEDAIETFQFTDQPFASANQNRIFHNGKIYVISGGEGAGLMFVLDLRTYRREVLINLNIIGITKEPETIFIWRDHLCIACRSHTNVYMLYFD